MAMKRIQFQPGLSLPTFIEQFGTEAPCAAALERARWPPGFRCPGGGQAGHYRLQSTHNTFQCHTCRRQTSLMAGTLFQSAPLALMVWFLAIYLISQAKTGLSALALKRQLGVSYPTAGLLQQKLMQAMAERDAWYTLPDAVQVDDAYVGGELTGGTAGRGAENKVPFVPAVSVMAVGHPQYVKLAPVPGFTRQAIADGARADLRPGCCVSADGWGCFAGVADAGCQPQPLIVSGRKPKAWPEVSGIKTVLGHLQTRWGGAYPAFDFAKYGSRYLAAFAYRFNRRGHLETLAQRLLVAAVTIRPRPAPWLRQAEASC